MPVLEAERASLSLLEKATLALLIAAIRPKIIVETGVWRGCTTRFISQFCTNNTIEAKIYGFDLPNVINELLHCDSFLAKTANVELCPGTLPESLRQWLKRVRPSIDLALIDANHSYWSVMTELRALRPYLAEDAYVLCHDYGRGKRSYEGVQCAINAFGARYGFAVLPLWSKQITGDCAWNAALLRRQAALSRLRRLYHVRRSLPDRYRGLAAVYARLLRAVKRHAPA